MTKRIFILILMLFMVIVNTKAQSIFISLNDGTIDEFRLSDICKLSFSGTDMLLHKTDATVYTLAISDIKKYTYGETTTKTDYLDNKKLDVVVYPNPSDGNINISYRVKEKGDVTVSIISLYGRVVKTLLSETKPAGQYTFTINAGVNSGSYLLRIQNDNYVTTKKIIILK